MSDKFDEAKWVVGDLLKSWERATKNNAARTTASSMAVEITDIFRAREPQPHVHASVQEAAEAYDRDFSIYLADPDCKIAHPVLADYFANFVPKQEVPAVSNLDIHHRPCVVGRPATLREQVEELANNLVGHIEVILSQIDVAWREKDSKDLVGLFSDTIAAHMEVLAHVRPDEGLRAAVADDDLACSIAANWQDRNHDNRSCPTCRARGDGIDDYRAALAEGGEQDDT